LFLNSKITFHAAGTVIAAKQSINTALVMAIVLVTSLAGVVVFLVVAGIERVVLIRRGQLR
jgi:hypothetical protein